MQTQMQQITDRSKLRMERLKQLELEQLQWEQEALVMPEDLNRALLLSFESVKTEFSDLDGLSWSRYPVPLVTNPWAHEEPTPKATCTELGEFPSSSDPCSTHPHAPNPHASHPRPSSSRHYSPLHPHRPSKSQPLSYAISSRAELASFAPEDTIRASRLLSQSSRSPLQPANQFFGVQMQWGVGKDHHGATHSMGHSHSHPASYVASHANAHLGYRSQRRPSYEQTQPALLRSQ
ncbi:hypothetical protein HYDPIDRAFT_114642 [Hydnomerulius pinastri MD-312]|uniref:Uncharacterized protein n=1 Tax=Hydnomerulius pinastri MD-312 TaxID=994086 RepID=A0A0C9WDI4_9AGAM|nr:hypothetical protein HYDPIDRAFT_114642 [Hydnomerulius pinastri MD-312]